MADRDTVKLTIDVLGQEGIDNLAKSTSNYKALLVDLAEKLKRGDISTDEYTRTQAKFTTEMERAQSLLDKIAKYHADEAEAAKRAAQAVEDEARAYEDFKRALAGVEPLAGKAAPAMEEAGKAATSVAGSKKAGGGGLLGASYAAQDFISVLQNNGGLGRALGSVSNNIPQLLTGLGMSSGLGAAFGAITAAAAAAVPIVEAWWTGMDSEKAESIKKKLEEVTKKVEAAQAAFDKLSHTPTDYEKESAGLTKEYLGMGANAELMQEGLAGSIGDKAALDSLTKEQREEYDKVGKDIIATKDMPTHGEAYELAKAKKEAAIARRAALLKEAKKQSATVLIQQAGEFTAEGSAARGRIAKLMQDNPDAFDPELVGGLGELTPAALQRSEQEMADEHAPGTEAYGARLKAARLKRGREAKERSEEIDQDYTANVNELDRSNAEWKARKAEARRQKKEKEQQAKREEAERKREAARARREPHEQAVRQAQALTAQAPEIVGANFGEQAGMSVATAPQAQLDEMTQQITRNLEQGQFPADAVLNAFRNIAEASARQAQANQQFAAQINGMGRMQGRMYGGTTQRLGPSGMGN